MVGSLFFTLKLTCSCTPCGKAACLAKLLVHQLRKLNPGGSCSPAGQKAMAAVPQALPAHASTGGCQPSKVPVSHGSAFSCLLCCTRTRGHMAAWWTSLILYYQFQLPWLSKMACSAVPWTLALAEGIAAVCATPATGHSGAHGNSHRLQHVILSCQY